jgi:hypothetical protein
MPNALAAGIDYGIEGTALEFVECVSARAVTMHHFSAVDRFAAQATIEKRHCVAASNSLPCQSSSHKDSATQNQNLHPANMTASAKSA